MKLIDIEDDALLKTVSLGGMSAKKLWKRIRSEREIEAIPIEWIEEWCKCLKENVYNVSYKNLNVLQERYEEYLKMERILSMMIEDWRRENE